MLLGNDGARYAEMARVVKQTVAIPPQIILFVFMHHPSQAHVGCRPLTKFTQGLVCIKILMKAMRTMWLLPTQVQNLEGEFLPKGVLQCPARQPQLQQ